MLDMSSPDTNGHQEVKRRRLTQACSLCHQRKTRCDGQKPQCATCLRNETACVYPPITQKRGPHRGNSDRLEKRLEQLEKKIDVISELLYKMTENPTFKAERPQEKTSPSLDSTPSDFSPLKTRLGFSLSSSFPSSNIGQLMTPELSLHLLKFYFEMLHPGFPIFHPATFFQRYERNEVPSYLLFAMYSVVAKFSDRTELKTDLPWKQGEIFETCALAQMVGINEFNLDYLASLLLMVKSLYQRGNGSRGWVYGGMAVRVAHFLGIHRTDEQTMNGETPASANWVLIERQRRLWWGCYTIDCYSCTATGRPPAIQDQLTFVSLPVENGTWDADPNNNIPSTIKPTNGEPLYTHYIRLITILNKVGRFINTPKLYRHSTVDTKKHIDLFDSLLAAWPTLLPNNVKLENVPLRPPLNYKGPPTYHVWPLHALYYGVIIILHTSRLGGDNYDQTAKQKCLKSADLITKLMSECFSYYPLSSTPFYFNYCLFLANTVYIDSLLDLSWEELSEGDNKFAINYKIIRENYANWSMADSYCKILKEIYDGKTRTTLSQSSITIPANIRFTGELSVSPAEQNYDETLVSKIRILDPQRSQFNSNQNPQVSNSQQRHSLQEIQLPSTMQLDSSQSSQLPNVIQLNSSQGPPLSNPIQLNLGQGSQISNQNQLTSFQGPRLPNGNQPNLSQDSQLFNNNQLNTNSNFPDPYLNFDFGLIDFTNSSQGLYMANPTPVTNDTSAANSQQTVTQSNPGLEQLSFNTMNQAAGLSNGSTQFTNGVPCPNNTEPDQSYLNSFMFFPSQAF